MAKAPVTALPEMPTEGIVLELKEPAKASDASTRSGSPSASSTTSERDSSQGGKRGQAHCSGLTWEALEKELLKSVSRPPPSAPLSPMQSKACILGSCPTQRARPSSIALPSDASERTPMATPASTSRGPAGGILLGTPAARPPLPRVDASQRTPSGVGVMQADISFMSSAMATSPTKRRGPALPMADASQRSPHLPMADASQRSPMTSTTLGPRTSFLSTAGTRSPACSDASQRTTPSASTPLSQQAAPASPLSTTPPPGSPASAAAAAAAAEANAAATAAAAKAAAEAAAQAAAAAAAAAKTAADAAAMAAAVKGDASQRLPQPASPSAAGAGPAAAACSAQQCTLVACDASGRQLFGKELEAELRAAAPLVYED